MRFFLFVHTVGKYADKRNDIIKFYHKRNRNTMKNPA